MLSFLYNYEVRAFPSSRSIRSSFRHLCCALQRSRHRPPARDYPFTCSRSTRSRSSASRSLSPVLAASSTACRSWFSSRIASQISKESRCARLVGGVGEGVRLRVWGWLRGQDGVGVGGWGSGGGWGWWGCSELARAPPCRPQVAPRHVRLRVVARVEHVRRALRRSPLAQPQGVHV